VESLTFDIVLVLFVLAVTVILFITEKLRVDVIAIMVMIALPWLGLVTPAEAFAGFSGNAVMSIIAVMIIGSAMDRTGVMNSVAGKLNAMAGNSESRLLAVVSAMVGVVSAFMQNVGSIALFLPAVLKICRQNSISPSRLLMPIGFSAILGGTLTMVGSGPLIILNDLLRSGGYEPFGLFSVTPVGMVLLAAGIVYFVVLGKFVLPSGAEGEDVLSPQLKLIRNRNIPHLVFRCFVPANSPLIDKTREEAGLFANYGLYLERIKEESREVHAPWRYNTFSSNSELYLLGNLEDVMDFAEDWGLELQSRDSEDILSSGESGFAEMMVLPGAEISGSTLREIALRRSFGVEPLEMVNTEGSVFTHFPDVKIGAGDIVIVEGPWYNLQKMVASGNFASLTPLQKSVRKNKIWPALFFFVTAIVLALSGFPLSLSLLSGALGMILFGVIRIDEAYQAVDWRTVFLLAGLIPLGTAMEKTGAAAFVAGGIMHVLSGSHPLFILGATGILATVFSLFMSNVAATVLLVPLVMIMGNSAGIDPRGLALLAGVCASNSFILPTHQVNAMLMSAGGYRNADYMRAGGIMTAVFLVIAVFFVYLLFV